MKFGLSENDINTIITTLREYPAVQQAIIFGSRAKGNFKKGSDIDMALTGDDIENVLWKIRDKLGEDTLMPYFFDLVDYDKINNVALKEHIDRVGVVVYERTSATMK